MKISWPKPPKKISVGTRELAFLKIETGQLTHKRNLSFWCDAMNVVGRLTRNSERPLMNRILYKHRKSHPNEVKLARALIKKNKKRDVLMESTFRTEKNVGKHRRGATPLFRSLLVCVVHRITHKQPKNWLGKSI